MTSQIKPILYSFRRCPYAMRARMAIVRAGLVCEHREVVLRDRPDHMMEISPKGTVPVMLLPSGKVIEESLEIMQYVANWTLTDLDNHWVNRNDNEFKFHLDRYKYPNRYGDVDALEQRDLAKKYLDDLDHLLLKTLSDELNDALFPFVRQFANHDREWFDSQQWDNLGQWLAGNLSSQEFKVCMKKYPQWFNGDTPVDFPIIE
ncbi:MAG TPA: glutathione S-transferase [Candidatus Poseidoniales archaeon]|nr:MAG TPA: glutathione S-transferase [Candidatus Poseidoniales archaeon]HII57450.1 glutathione S-transferase [Candidatus Poseidoniaceae archaeon]